MGRGLLYSGEPLVHQAEMTGPRLASTGRTDDGTMSVVARGGKEALETTAGCLENGTAPGFASRRLCSLATKNP